MPVHRPKTLTYRAMAMLDRIAAGERIKDAAAALGYPAFYGSVVMGTPMAREYLANARARFQDALFRVSAGHD